jgi:hypothetical protein
MTALPERSLTGAAKRLALVTLLAGVLVALLGLLVPPASASPILHTQTRVAAITEPNGQLVRPSRSVATVQGRERAPNHDSSATGSSVAAEGGVRGLSPLGGIIEETGTNAAGGRVFTSTGAIAQNDFAGIVNAGVIRGEDVAILTGAHGLGDGSLTADSSLYTADVARFGDLPGVYVHDIMSMSPAEIRAVLQGSGTIIGGFCHSGACLAPPGPLRRMNGPPVSRNEQRPLKEFVGFIWIGDDPGIRLAVQAPSVEEAKALVIAEYGEGHRISLWNEDDARRARHA